MGGEGGVRGRNGNAAGWREERRRIDLLPELAFPHAGRARRSEYLESDVRARASRGGGIGTGGWRRTLLTMGSLKFWACTSELISAALWEEEGGGGGEGEGRQGSAIETRVSDLTARRRERTRGQRRVRVARGAPFRLQLIRRARRRVEHGEVELHPSVRRPRGREWAGEAWGGGSKTSRRQSGSPRPRIGTSQPGRTRSAPDKS